MTAAKTNSSTFCILEADLCRNWKKSWAQNYVDMKYMLDGGRFFSFLLFLSVFFFLNYPNWIMARRKRIWGEEEGEGLASWKINNATASQCGRLLVYIHTHSPVINVKYAKNTLENHYHSSPLTTIKFQSIQLSTSVLEQPLHFLINVAQK